MNGGGSEEATERQVERDCHTLGGVGGFSRIKKLMGGGGAESICQHGRATRAG